MTIEADAARYATVVDMLLTARLHPIELIIAAWSHAVERGGEDIEKQDIDKALDTIGRGTLQ